MSGVSHLDVVNARCLASAPYLNMQAQARPPSAQTLQSHPALPPSIPRKEVQGLIPRLTTAINDIDAFKAQLAAGAQDGSLPNW